MERPTTTTAPPDAWQGRLIRLRAIEPSDWPVYFAWNRDDEQARGVSCRPWFPQSEEAVKEWARHESTRTPDDDGFRFVIADGHGDRRVGSFSPGVTIRREHRRKGYATEAIALVLRSYFQELRYQKLPMGVNRFNEASIRLHQALGFQVEGRIRRTAFSRGQWFDELVSGFTAEEAACGPVAALLAARGT